MDLRTIQAKYDKVIVWGCGNKFISACTDDFNIDYIVDADVNKQGTFCKRIKVEAPEKIFEEDMSKILILIFSIYWRDIVVQINDMGITADVMLASMIDSDARCQKYGSCYKKAFAGFAEDAVIMGISKRFGLEINHYLDIGANHPINGNATILFYLGGASGCLIEPNSAYIDSIKASRPGDTVLNLGIAGIDSDGDEREYYEVVGLDTRNTFSKELAEHYRKNGFKICTKLVKLISLSSLLELYGEKVDYINIDVEGLEYEILKDFDFETYDINFFNIEKGNIEVKKLMLQNHYELVAETLSNWIFVKERKAKEKI